MDHHAGTVARSIADRRGRLGRRMPRRRHCGHPGGQHPGRRACWARPTLAVFLLVTTVIGLGSLLATGSLHEAGLRFISESLGLGQESLRPGLPPSRPAGGPGEFRRGCPHRGLRAWRVRNGHRPRFAARLLVVLAAAGVVALAWQQIAAESLRGWNELRLASLFSGGQGGGPLSNLLFVLGLAIGAGISPRSGLGSPWPCSSRLSGRRCRSRCLALFRTSRPVLHPDAADLPVLLRPDDSRQLYSAAGSLLIVQLLTFAIYQLDVWIGGMLLDAGELGLYGAAKRCQLLAQMPVQMAMMTVISTIPRLHAQGRLADLQRVVRAAATLAAMPSLIVLALLALMPDRVCSAPSSASPMPGRPR